MVNIFILLILFVGVYSGYKKGVIIKLLETIGFVIVIIYALDYYKVLSEYLYLLIPYPTPFAPETNPYLFYEANYMFTMDRAYYHILSFLAIFFAGWLIVKFIARLTSYTLERLRAPEPLSGIGGAVLGFIVNYVGIFFLFILLSTIPYAMVQDRLAESTLANFIITSTPKLSESMHQRFIVEANEEAIAERQTMDLEIPEDVINEDNVDEQTDEEQE